MQLATITDGQPWVVTVHFYADDELNLYWLSKKSRDHSQHITQNSNVATTIMVHENTPGEDYVIGITIQCKAELLAPPLGKEITNQYVNKLLKDPSLIDVANDPDGTEGFYILRPEKIVLFDNKDFPNDPRQLVTL
jgi:hypothetical protein